MNVWRSLLRLPVSEMNYASLVSKFRSGLISARQTKAVCIKYLIFSAYIYKPLILTNHPRAAHRPGFFSSFESVASAAWQQPAVDTDDVHFPSNAVGNGVSPGLYPSIFGPYGKHELASIPPATPQPC